MKRQIPFLGHCNPSIAVNKHLTVKNDAFSTLVGEVTKYNSVHVNTSRRSIDGYKLPGSREKSGAVSARLGSYHMAAKKSFKNITTLNWKNGLFRLWIALTVCWGLFVLFVTIDEGFFPFAIFVALWPFMFLIVAVVLFKTGKWVFLGLTQKDDLTDNISNKIDHAISVKAIMLCGKKTGFYLLMKLRKIVFFTVAIFLLICVVIVADMGMNLVVQPNPNLSWGVIDESPYKMSEIPPLPPGFTLDAPSMSERTNINHPVFTESLMSIYRVKAPDGRVISLKGQEGANQEEIIKQAKLMDQSYSTSNTHNLKSLNSYSISFPAIMLFTLGFYILFRKIMLSKKSALLVKIGGGYITVIIVDSLLVRYGLNPLFPKVNAQVFFFIGLIGYLVLKPFKKKMIETGA